MAKDEVQSDFSLGKWWVQPFWDEISLASSWYKTQLALFGDFYLYKGANSNENWVIGIHKDYGSTNLGDE